MKELVSFFAILMMSMAIPHSVSAYDFSYTYQGKTLYYQYSGTATVTVTYQNSSNPRYTNLSGTVVIPSSVTNNGTTYSVTSIGVAAFEGCCGLTSVAIPNSVISIGDIAFAGCNGLTSVTIPNSVTSIGYDAFYRCSGLTSVTIPNSVTSIGERAFSDCTDLTSVIFNADSCTSAGSSSSPAFQNCTHITNFTFGDSVKVIPSYLCSGLTGLTSVTIPNSVASIGMYAFYLVRHIEYNGCATGSPWGAISMNGYKEGDFVYPDNTKTNLLAYIGTGGDVTILNSVTSIGNYAFSGCSGLTSVTIPNSVTSIGYDAFCGCSNLTSVTIPNSVTSIGGEAFCGCSSLNSVTIPNSVTSIGGEAFCGCSSLNSVTIGNSVTYIGNCAFQNCSVLTSVTIGNSVTYIDNGAFSGCSGLTSVTIPNSVTFIGEGAFFGCCAMDTVFMMPEVAPNLGNNCFYCYDYNYYVIPCVFYISCGSYNSYYNGSGWYEYRTALHEPEVAFELLINTNDSIKGIASIVQQNERDVACDSSAIIIATASYGYHFDHWSNGNTANPDTLHLVGDSTVTAIFAVNQYELAVQSADESLGSADGSGTYDYLDTVEISATGINHHHFLHWNDGNRDNPRRVVVTCDTSFTAHFAIDTHTVNVVTSDIARGMVETTGTEFVYGTPCTVTATAYTGYTFAGWSNGVTANPYTFAVLSDVELTALFIAEGEEVYTVNVESANPTMGTVSGGGQALDGGSVVIRAAGNPGYHFTQWNDGNTDSVRTVVVHGNVTYTAYFASDNGTEGIDEPQNRDDIQVLARNHSICISGACGQRVYVYGIDGRMVATRRNATEQVSIPVPTTGVYFVKVGNLSARKVVVIR